MNHHFLGRGYISRGESSFWEGGVKRSEVNILGGSWYPGGHYVSSNSDIFRDRPLLVESLVIAQHAHLHDA